MSKTRSLGILAALAAVVLHAAPAAAQGQESASGFALGRFTPAPAGSHWFVLDSLDQRGHLEPAASLALDWGYKPLVIYDEDGAERSALVEHQAFLHLGASLALWDLARLSLDLPIAVYQAGTDGQLGLTRYTAPGSGGFGDLRLGADFFLGGRPGDPIRLAVGLQAYVPTGSAEQYLGDGKARFSPRVLMAGDTGPWMYSGELGFDYRGLGGNYGGTPLGSQLRIAAAAGWRGLDGRLVVGPEIYGNTQANGFLERGATALEGIVGARYRVWQDLVLGAGVGTGLSRGLGTPRARGIASLAWVPTKRAVAKAPLDTDGDGITDLDDACPEEPGVPSPDLRKNGCPPPAADSDRDGVVDADDVCPEEPAGETPDPARRGCPKPPDRDADGIADAKDACPDDRGPPSMNPARNGCPPDSDGDGVLDPKDACPQVPGAASADAKLNGCPPDRDRDGVPDASDLCPAEPAGEKPDEKRAGCPFKDADTDGLADWADNCPTEPGPATNQGCPVKQKQLVVITRERLEIREKVYFASGKSRILRKSNALLDQVAGVLAAHPEITRIVVEGHTDDRGGADLNRKLSKARAEAVRAYLVKKGIAATRLDSKGYGPDKPASTNATAAGREKNRRVEFTLPGEQSAAPAQPSDPDLSIAPLVPEGGSR